MDKKIVLVDKNNYHMFDDMIFYRAHKRYKTDAELSALRDFTEQYVILEKNLLTTYAMEIDNNFVGYISTIYIPKITQNNNGFMFVDDLWVNPNYRRMGIAELLMKKAETFAQENKTYGLRLYVSTNNDAGASLYEKCGLTNKYGESMLMEKILST